MSEKEYKFVSEQPIQISNFKTVSKPLTTETKCVSIEDIDLA